MQQTFDSSTRDTAGSSSDQITSQNLAPRILIWWVQVGRYRTPGGADIDRTGILPDFRAPPSPEVAAARLRACVPPPRV